MIPCMPPCSFLVSSSRLLWMLANCFPPPSSPPRRWCSQPWTTQCPALARCPPSGSPASPPLSPQKAEGRGGKAPAMGTYCASLKVNNSTMCVLVQKVDWKGMCSLAWAGHRCCNDWGVNAGLSAWSWDNQLQLLDPAAALMTRCCCLLHNLLSRRRIHLNTQNVPTSPKPLFWNSRKYSSR